MSKSKLIVQDNLIKAKDSLVNLIANLGTIKDKRTHTKFEQKDYDRTELESMYVDDWLSGKIIDVPVDDMTRKWRKFISPTTSQDDIEKVEREETRLAIKAKINECKKWARLYGGSIIILGIDGTGNSEIPLDINKIKKDSLKFMHVIDRWDLSVYEINQLDPTKPSYRMPEFYTMYGGTRKIHYTRVLRFDGIWLPWQLRKRNNYWGGSVLQRLYDAISNSQTIANATASLTYESSVNIVKIPNLFQQLASKDGEKVVHDRFVMADMLKSINNMLLLDQNEDFISHKQTFQGLPDLILKFLNIVGAAADIPATRLLGVSAPGLNATGEFDLKNYYDMVASKQESEFGPQLTYLDQILVRSTLGHMPDDWSFEFNSLWEVSDVEKADIELKNAQRDQIYLDQGVVIPSVVADELRENNVYNGIDDEFVKTLQEIETADYIEKESTEIEVIPNEENGESAGSDDSSIESNNDDSNISKSNNEKEEKE